VTVAVLRILIWSRRMQIANAEGLRLRTFEDSWRGRREKVQEEESGGGGGGRETQSEEL
jgi:hypothetical protein